MALFFLLGLRFARLGLCLIGLSQVDARWTPSKSLYSAQLLLAEFEMELFGLLAYLLFLHRT